MACLCLGPSGAGKTHLFSALQDPEKVDNTTYSIPTTGTNIYKLILPSNRSKSTSRRHQNSGYVTILEIGGSLAPLWRKYYQNVDKIIFVVDTSNLCQISAAGVLLYSILAEPQLQRTEILLVLAKMDLAYRQMRNEALLMLQMTKLKKQIRQSLTIIEASAITGVGLDKITEWLAIKSKKTS